MVLASAAMLLGCSEKENNTVYDRVDTSVDTLRFSPDGGTLDLKVSSSGEWRLSGLSDWVRPSMTEGNDGATITFTAEPNGKETREACFKLFSGSAVKKVVAISTPADLITLLSEPEVNFVCDGGTAYVRLDTNVPDLEISYSGDGADWISFEEKLEALGVTMQRFKVKKSGLLKDRESIVTIKGAGKSVDIRFVQSQRDTIISDESRAVFDLAARDVKIKVRTNVDFDCNLSDWMTKTEVTTGVTDESGLTEKTINIHLEEASASRFYTVKLSKNNTEYVSYFIKQQNPNPIIGKISDANLRVKLNELEWILASEGSDECELLERGLKETNLTLAGTSNYYKLDVTDLSGIGVFPKLETLNISLLTAVRIDVSSSKSLQILKLQRMYGVSEIDAGESPVNTIDFTGYNNDYLSTSELAISGKNVKKVIASCTVHPYNENLTSLDVTGCVDLIELKANRSSTRGCKLKTIYVTAAQKAAIDAGALTVEKSDLTSIEVK